MSNEKGLGIGAQIQKVLSTLRHQRYSMNIMSFLLTQRGLSEEKQMQLYDAFIASSDDKTSEEYIMLENRFAEKFKELGFSF